MKRLNRLDAENLKNPEVVNSLYGIFRQYGVLAKNRNATVAIFPKLSKKARTNFEKLGYTISDEVDRVKIQHNSSKYIA